MRNSNTFFFAFMFLLATASSSFGAEFITVPADGVANVVDDNYSLAKKKAINAAFRKAIRLASAGLASSEEYGANRDIIEKSIVVRGSAFVSSYKILDETIDPDGQRITINMQITLFLDSVRTALRQGGVGVKRPPLPNLVVLVDEKNAEFFSNPNFLMLDSLSEDILSRAYEQRGYAVFNRTNIRDANMSSVALDAYSRKRTSLMQLRRALEADLFVFGSTEVLVEKEEDHSVVTAHVTADIVDSNGETLATYTNEASGTFLDPLSGSLELINVACSKLIQKMTVETPRIWRQASRGYSGG